MAIIFILAKIDPCVIGGPHFRWSFHRGCPSFLILFGGWGIRGSLEFIFGSQNGKLCSIRSGGLEWRKGTAEKLAHKALSLDDSYSGGHLLLGSVYLMGSEYKKAVAVYRKAIALSPNSAAIHAWLGIALLHVEGQARESINEFKTARRLDPFPPNCIFNYSAIAHRVNGEYKKAIEILQKVIKRNPDEWPSYFELAADNGLLGREDEAKTAAAEVLRIGPEFTIEMIYDHEFRDKADKERTIEILQRGGAKTELVSFYSITDSEAKRNVIRLNSARYFKVFKLVNISNKVGSIRHRSN